jgi:hypothetical protein
VISNSSAFEKKPSTFHEVWRAKLHYEKNGEKGTLMFEYYNLLDPMERGIVII